MRLAVYTDYVYRAKDGRVYGERAFVLFLAQMTCNVDELTIVGRLHPNPSVSHYPLPESTRFVGLPHYETLARPFEVLGSISRSLGRFWRVLDGVDAVWLMGPFLHSIAFVGLAALRHKRIALGVRQNLPALTRSRTGLRWMHWAADILEAVWKLLAFRLPVVVVGPELARRYRHAQALLPITVSLISERDIGAPARNWDGPRQILSVGRLEREKNPLLLADILSRLRTAGGDWRLVVCGDGPMQADLKERLFDLGLSDYSELCGYVPLRTGLLDVYRSAHALLHVSWSEGLPQVLFEAFATGLPVVATAVGGVAEAAQGAALLIPPGNSESAVLALERLAAEPALRETLTVAGLERARTHTIEVETARVAAFILGRPSPDSALVPG